MNKYGIPAIVAAVVGLVLLYLDKRGQLAFLKPTEEEKKS